MGIILLRGVFAGSRYLCGMGRFNTLSGTLLIGVSLALVATACNTRPTSDAFDASTTTSSTLLVEDVATTTTPTLPPPEERITATVVSVTDGDTITVSLGGVEIDLRMLGINAPELSECWGPESSAALAAMVENTSVLLVAGEEDVDQFDRVLRYVFLETSDGPVFVNQEMVKSGNAIGMSNGHEQNRNFKLLEARAFESGLGMWATFACGNAEGIAADRPVVRVSEVQYDPDGPDDERLEDEFVVIVNEGYGRVFMSGWVLRDESSSNRLTLPNQTVLAPGESLTIVTGCTGGPEGAVHWCSDNAVWSNQGDTVIVSDTLGNAVIRYAYAADDQLG